MELVIGKGVNAGRGRGPSFVLPRPSDRRRHSARAPVRDGSTPLSRNGREDATVHRKSVSSAGDEDAITASLRQAAGDPFRGPDRHEPRRTPNPIRGTAVNVFKNTFCMYDPI